MSKESLVVTGNTTHTRPENRAFYPALDGLRAAAFGIVFLQHYVEVPWTWAGVDVFFVLSGFLITGILFDTRDDPHRARNFYVRRTLRIFPLYYGVILLTLLAWPILHWQWSAWWLAWPVYLGNMLTLVPAGATGSARDLALYGHLHGQLHGRPVLIFFGHFWSLCVEEQFYLAWPWVVFWVRDRRRLMWICAISLPLCLALRMVSENALPLSITVNHPAHELLVCRADALLTGGLIALWLRGPGADALLRWSRWLFPVAMTAAFTWAFLVPPRWMKWHFYPFPSWLNTWGLLAIELLAGLLLLNLLQPSNPLYKVFNLRPLRFLGRISYGMYVFHDIVHGPLNSLANWLLPGSLWLTSVLALAGTILLAWLSFRFLESPFLNMKERWTRTA